MMRREDATSKDLSTTRDARLARRRLDRHERYLSLLRLAHRTRLDNGFQTDKLEALIKQAEDELGNLAGLAKGRILQRGRPNRIALTPTYTVFLDECGTHSLKAKDSFQAFAFAAVIVSDEAFPSVDHAWRAWKAHYLGSPEKRVHEPDVRKGSKSFFCDGDLEKRRQAVAALPDIIGSLNFTAIACVVHRARYLAEFGDAPMDDSLPQHPYLMTMHFMAERVALALEHHLGGGKARLVVESRGELEDANLQYEFARLFLDGTSYVSSSWFRHQFLPGLEFRGKEDNSTGLQLADLVARPCAEKVIDPLSTPARWNAVRQKLCPGIHTGNSIVGMKVVPWSDDFAQIWES